MLIACVLVHYHTPELARRAAASVQRDAAADGIETETVIVDNGSDEDERRQLADIPARRLFPGVNLGYAAALNLGIAQTTAPFLVLMNCDVELIDGCLRHLSDALQNGAAAAGPRLYLDRRKQLVLPPLEEHTRRAELLRMLAARGEPWCGWARRSWRQHARRHWLAEQPLQSPWLSGALMAIRRDVWESVGPFDERYQLYFEEIDWLLRLQRHGLTSTYVPVAEAFHWYNRSAAREPKAPEWFEASGRRFAARHYGRAFLAAVRPLRHRPAVVDRPSTGAVPSIDLAASDRLQRPLWVELSASPTRFPAAAARVDQHDSDRWSLEPEVWQQLWPGRYALTVVDAGGVEWGVAEFVRNEEGCDGVPTVE